MKRSQLGLLAESFANGEINRPAYERERSALIEDITSGRIQITRRKPGDSAESTPSQAGKSAHSALRLAVAASAMMVLLVLVWLAAPAA